MMKRNYILISISLVLLVNISIYLFASTDLHCVIRGLNQLENIDSASTGELLDSSYRVRTLLKMRSPSISEFVIDDQAIYATSTKCNNVKKIGLNDGKEIWSATISGASELILDPTKNQVYVTTTWAWKRRIISLDSNTGVRKWKNTFFDRQRVGLHLFKLIDSDYAVYVSPAGDYFTLDPDDGNLSPTDFSPEYGEFRYLLQDKYYWVVRQNKVLAIDWKSGELLWQIELQGPEICCIQQSYLWNDLLVLANDNHVFVFNNETGNLEWQVSLEQVISLTFFDQAMYMVDNDGHITVSDLLTGNEIFSFNLTDGEFDSGSIQVSPAGDKILVYQQGDDTIQVLEVNEQS